jgi:hypothetical protein
MTQSYLPPGLPRPLASGLDQPFWDGLREERLLLQRCRACHRFQWGPEWICHRCLSFAYDFVEVPAEGRLYSHQRVWHPVHPVLQAQGPYIIALVEIPHADNVRLVGNLLGDPQQPLTIGAELEAVFEQHAEAEPPFALLQWRVVG